MCDTSRPSAQQANLLGKGDEEVSKSANRFDITICGKTVEENFSPADNNRYLNACRKRYIIQNDGDCINIIFNKIGRASCREEC